MDTAQTYTYEDAYEASLKYFDGDELAAQVWVTKYALKDSATETSTNSHTPTTCTADWHANSHA